MTIQTYFVLNTLSLDQLLTNLETLQTHKQTNPENDLNTNSTIQKLKDNLKNKIDNIDNSQHPIDFNNQNPEDKLKSLDDSVKQIDELTKNFKKATLEEENSHNDIAAKLKDVIANKGDPHELLEELNKSQNESLDIDEMLHKGHINKKYTQFADLKQSNNITGREDSKINSDLKNSTKKQVNQDPNIVNNNVNLNKDVSVQNMLPENKKDQNQKINKNSNSAINKVQNLNNQNILKKQNSVVSQNINIESPPINQDDNYQQNTNNSNIVSKNEINDIYSDFQTDQDDKIGRNGDLVHIYPQKLNANNDLIEPMVENVYMVLNSHNLTIFKSRNLLNILYSAKLSFIDIKDLQGTDCFVIKNKFDKSQTKQTLCANNITDKEEWILNIRDQVSKDQ